MPLATAVAGVCALSTRPPPAPPPPVPRGGVSSLQWRGLSAPVRLISAPPRKFSVAASGAWSDELDARDRSRRIGSNEKSVVWNLIKEIEPLDTSVIQKDVPAVTVDAIKRTISNMLGLLPSDHFGIAIEAPWNPFMKLFISSVMTGYTLRNAEYRLSFEKNFEFSEEENLNHKRVTKDDDSHSNNAGRHEATSNFLSKCDLLPDSKESTGEQPWEIIFGIESLSSEAKDIIGRMQSQLNSMQKELHDLKRKNSALQMQQFAGEEKNDLLDYLRSLTPEKVSELSEPTCPGVHEAISSVVHGLLATLSPRINSTAPPQSKSVRDGILNLGADDCAELVENASLNFQPLISVPRDYLARLLFWCMLLGHYIRGMEYRIELMQLLTVPSNPRPNPCDK